MNPKAKATLGWVVDFGRSVWVLLRAFGAGMLRVWDALVIWFSGEDLAAKNVTGAALYRALRFRVKASLTAVGIMLAVFGFVWRKACTGWGLSAGTGLWVTSVAVLGPAFLVICWAGWDRNLTGNTPLPAPAPARSVDKDTVREAVATVVPKLKADQYKTIGVVTPGLRQDGDWWDIFLSMPLGIDWKTVRKYSHGIAVHLGYDEDRIIVGKGPNGTTRISGTDKPLWSRERVTPLAEAQRTSVFKPAPLATDARGAELATMVLFTGVVIGAIPRQGKTQAARLIALFWALDPGTDIAYADFKGQGDWAMFRKLAVFSVEGRGKDKVRALKDYLKWVQQEITRRTDVMNKLAERGSGVDSQLTEKLAGRADLKLRPLGVFVDEAQYAITDRDHGQDIADMLEDIVKVGPSVGIMILLATQKPDSQSIPTRIRDNMGTRVALRVRSWQASQAILGTEAQSAGWDASTISEVKGVSIYLGADDESTVAGYHEVRWDRCDADLAWRICERAERLRRGEGVLPEGEDVDPPAVLVEMHRVLSDPLTGGKMRSIEMAEHLADLGLIDGESTQQRVEQVAAIVRPWSAYARKDQANPLYKGAKTWFLDGPGGVDAAIKSRPANFRAQGVSQGVSTRVSGGVSRGVSEVAR